MPNMCFQRDCLALGYSLNSQRWCGGEEVSVSVRNPSDWRGFYNPTLVITFPEDLMPFHMQP